jgi:fatty acid synthase, animal type
LSLTHKFNFLRIYENGVDLDLAKLYPQIEFPVSRGTPMISPLIKWDHSESHFVTKFEERASKKGERFLNVNTSDPENEFLFGHAIDGELRFELF